MPSNSWKGRANRKRKRRPGGSPSGKDGPPGKGCSPERYDQCTVENMQYLYIFLLILWVLILTVLGIFSEDNDGISFLILAVPPILFLIAYVNLPDLSPIDEERVAGTNILTVGLLVAFPIFTWIYDKSKISRTLFNKVLIAAIIFSILAMIDIWIPCDLVPYEHHIRSALQTFAFTLFIFALYRFYVTRETYQAQREQEKATNNNNNNNGNGYNNSNNANVTISGHGTLAVAESLASEPIGIE